MMDASREFLERLTQQRSLLAAAEEQDRAAITLWGVAPLDPVHATADQKRAELHRRCGYGSLEAGPRVLALLPDFHRQAESSLRVAAASGDPIMRARAALLWNHHRELLVHYGLRYDLADLDRYWVLDLHTKALASIEELLVAKPIRIKTGGLTVNERMYLKMHDRPESHGWSAQQWADALDCGKTTVAESAAWKSLKVVKADAAVRAGASPKDRRRKSQASDVNRNK